MAMKQEQFLEVIDREEAHRRFRDVVRLEPLGTESIDLGESLGRTLARDVVAERDVPAFDRSNFDGFAVRAADTYGASEEDPRVLRLVEEWIATAVVPRCDVAPGAAAAIATGGMLPRGADSVVLVEDTDTVEDAVLVRRAVVPGYGVTYAGTDIAAGETVLWRGDLLTSRETGVLAALGQTHVEVFRQPRVGIVSTGDEIQAPGEPLRLGHVYDSNARILADAVRELGAVPVMLGIVCDNPEQLRATVSAALVRCDVVLLSGGTSKGAGDISYQIVRELTHPGIVAHGVALKPGKPICLAAHGGKPVVVLPGFPTSAIFTFHEFVAPVILALGGRAPEARADVSARLAVRVNSDIGRTEYLLVWLAQHPDPGHQEVTLTAYPLGQGSGSVTTFSRADGFVTIGRHEEIVAENAIVSVRLLSPSLKVADLVVMGSHCVGLDYLLGQLQMQSLVTKFLAVGSTAGLEAARRAECDVAGIHLLDPATGTYNEPFLPPDVELIPGYRRRQGVVFRRGDARFEGLDATAAIARAVNDPACVMVNRNGGSGTRIIIDQLLRGVRPPGYALQPRNHNAVAAAVAQGRADWGLAIQRVSEQAGLGFLPVTEEQYDFVVAVSRSQRPAVAAFRRLLVQADIRAGLAQLGCRPY
jgi:putative molybdopterin biosynthesis protein